MRVFALRTFIKKEVKLKRKTKKKTHKKQRNGSNILQTEFESNNSILKLPTPGFQYSSTRIHAIFMQVLGRNRTKRARTGNNNLLRTAMFLRGLPKKTWRTENILNLTEGEQTSTYLSYNSCRLLDMK